MLKGLRRYKMETKKLINLVVIVALLISLALNLYFFGWKLIERRIYARGVNDAFASIVNEVQRNRQVILNTQNGSLTLILKPEEKE